MIAPLKAMKNLAKRHPRLSKALFSLTLFCVLAASMELFFGWRNSVNNQYSPHLAYLTPDGEIFFVKFVQSDPVVGYKPKENSTVRCIMKDEKITYYDIEYRTDQYCRRITPVPDDGPRDKFLIFFGCSFTIGQGVKEDETLPAQVARRAPGYRPYNYGVCGHGPQTMLAKMRSRTLPQEIAEKKGILIFVLLPFHVERAVGSMSVIARWGRNLPCYEANGDGALRCLGSFESGRPYTCLFYSLLDQSQTVRYFQSDLPRLRHEHYLFTARLLAESRESFREQFPDSEFRVMLFPNPPCPELVAACKELEIECLDYSNALPFEITNWSVDGHPMPRAYELVSKRLVADLKIGADGALPLTGDRP